MIRICCIKLLIGKCYQSLISVNKEQPLLSSTTPCQPYHTILPEATIYKQPSWISTIMLDYMKAEKFAIKSVQQILRHPVDTVYPLHQKCPLLILFKGFLRLLDSIKKKASFHEQQDPEKPSSQFLSQLKYILLSTGVNSSYLHDYQCTN